jgi:hypothetical protein
VFLGAVQILQVLGNSNSKYSIYIHVYEKILGRFLSVMVTFTPLFLSFVIVFSIVFPKAIIITVYVLQKIIIINYQYL